MLSHQSSRVVGLKENFSEAFHHPQEYKKTWKKEFAIYLNVLIWHEVILIGGWVPIWEAIDIELFRDTKERKKEKLKKDY